MPLSSEELTNISQKIPHLAESPKLQFLAEKHLLPQQNEIDSFETPSLLTQLRRGMFGNTKREQQLIKRQDEALVPFLQEQKILTDLSAKLPTLGQVASSFGGELPASFNLTPEQRLPIQPSQLQGASGMLNPTAEEMQLLQRRESQFSPLYKPEAKVTMPQAQTAESLVGGHIIEPNAPYIPTSLLVEREKTKATLAQPQSPIGKIIGDIHRTAPDSPDRLILNQALDQELFKGVDISKDIKDRLISKGITNPTTNDINNALQQVRADKLADQLGEARGKAAIGLGTETVRQQVFANTGINDMSKATPEQVGMALETIYQRELKKSRETGAGQIQEHPIEQGERDVVTGLGQVITVARALQSEFTPEERAKYAGLVNLPVERVKTLLNGPNADPRFVRFYALLKEQGLTAFAIAGKQLTGIEKDTIFGFIPTGTEWSPVEFDAKLNTAIEYASSNMDKRIMFATTPRKDLRNKLMNELKLESKNLSNTKVSGQTTIRTDADFNALPSGTIFVGPDGKKRRKP